MDRFLEGGIRAVRRIVIGVLGFSVVAVGLALLVLPGPAFVVIPIGLAILAIEFEWARRWLRRAREFYGSATGHGVPADAAPTGSHHRNDADPSSTGVNPPAPPDS